MFLSENLSEMLQIFFFLSNCSNSNWKNHALVTFNFQRNYFKVILWFSLTTSPAKTRSKSKEEFAREIQVEAYTISCFHCSSYANVLKAIIHDNMRLLFFFCEITM